MQKMNAFRAALIVLVLVALSMTTVRHAHAQDAEEAPSQSGRRADFACLIMDVDDVTEGVGEVFFTFIRGEPRAFEFFWNAENFAYGPMEGAIRSKRIFFEGNAGDGCTVAGSGVSDTGEKGDLSGSFKFFGSCAEFFTGGTFSTAVNTGCLVVPYNPKEKNWQAND
jgi:hypothetical protein